MIHFPILNHYPSCYSANSYIPKSQVGEKNVKVLLDRIATDDRPHTSSLIKIVSLVFIAAVIINRSGCLIENGKATILPIKVPDISTPCTYSATHYRVFMNGDCNKNQINDAFALRDSLYDQREKDLEAKGHRMADESNKKWQASIDESKKEKEEFIREFYPSPEEVEAKSLRTQREIHCQMDEMLAWWPLYTPQCVKNEIELLGGKMSDNCTTIKKLYKQQSILIHPDHNKAPDANEKFNSIAEAYKKICP